MKQKKILYAISSFVLIGSLIVIAGCNANNSSESQQKNSLPIVAVTIVPERTFVQAVCGDLVEVITMVPPGNSPENYEPTPSEMKKFSDASIYFSIGVPTEEANILPNLGEVQLVSLQEKVASVYSERTFASGARDPHIWLSPKRVKVMIETIASEMSQLDPNNATTYRENAAAYLKQLDQVDTEITSALSDVKNRSFFVFHPAFGYFADDYQLEMYSLEENGKEATPQHLQDMIDLAKKDNIKVIFYQAEVDSAQSQAFAEEVGGKTMQLSPLAANYIENLKSMAQLMAEVME